MAKKKKASAQTDFLSRLLSFRGVLAFWILHGIAHSLLRMAITRTLTLDDARENELVQNFALGYQVRQPPLYEWLLWGSQQLLGTGIESHLLVRYSLIAALGVATFGAVRAALKNDRWAAAASLSLAFSYPVGWMFHEWATQTILLCIACMATIHASIRYFESPSVKTAIWLGLSIGLGLQAKFSYPLFLAALAVSAVSLPATRKRLTDPRLLISVFIAFLAIAPYLYWLLNVQGSLVGEVTRHMITDTRPHFVRVGVGLWRLMLSLVTFLLPWILFVALIVPRAFWPETKKTPKPSMAENLVLRTMILSIALAAIGIVMSGSTTIRVPYMHVMLFIVPVYLFARIARLSPGTDTLRKFAVFALLAEVVIFGVRFAGATDNPLTRKLNRGIAVEYTELVDVLKQRGITSGTLISVAVRDAGNLRAFMPDLRIRGADSFRTERAPRRPADAQSCVLVFRDGQQPNAAIIVRPDALTPERLELKQENSGLFSRLDIVWFLVRLDPKHPACS